MTDNNWLTVSRISEELHIPVETIRRYIRSHSVHLRVKKQSKRYLIHDESMVIIKQIRALYDRGMNVNEVEETLSASGIPMTITVKNDNDEAVTVHVADEFQGLNKKLEQQEKFIQQLLEQNNYLIKKFDELKYDRDLVQSLRDSMNQKKLESTENEELKNIEKELKEIKESLSQTAAQQEESKRGLLARIFGR